MSSVSLVTKIINKENLEKELFELFSCVDEDFIGEDYLWEEARNEGFSSNLEYSLKNAKEKYEDDLESIIREVIKNAQSTWGAYYDSWQEVIIKTENNIVVSIATSVS